MVQKDFVSFKGKLLLPVDGKITKSDSAFDKDVNEKSKSNGVEILAPLGKQVRSIFVGKVVYADWFSGYGKVVILDHGDGYLSLYAHLSEINVKVGIEVRENQVIGAVGDTGSLKGVYLYLEIRKEGVPLDPMEWFEK